MTHPALIFAQACASTYADGAVPAFQDDVRTVHVFTSKINGLTCFAFEGTNTFWEWLIDFMAFKIPFKHADYGPVHLGLMRDVMAVKQKIVAFLDAEGNPPYCVAGHSKGAGEAILLHAEMKSMGYAPMQTWAFEPPRVGTHILRDYLAGEPIGWTATRNSHGRDLVTLVPNDDPLIPLPDILLPWREIGGGMELIVPDDDDLAAKHRIPAILTALAALP